MYQPSSHISNVYKILVLCIFKCFIYFSNFTHNFFAFDFLHLDERVD